jgi:hypothetical protein
MKKLFFAPLFFIFCNFLLFSTTNQEEIDFLLFMPNSSDQLAHAERDNLLLDNLAKFLAEKNLLPGQIHVYGYAAVAQNDLDGNDLSRARAVFIMHELQRRGVVRELFSDPAGFGSVDLWGDNTGDEDRLPNRRVRILLEGRVLMPPPAVEPAPAPPVVEEPVAAEREERAEPPFPWWIIPLLLAAALLAALLFFLAKKKRTRSAADPVPAAASIPTPGPAAARETDSDLDEEIRFRAYELYLMRYGQSEDAVADWHVARAEICAKYEADGCRAALADDGHWHSFKTVRE